MVNVFFDTDTTNIIIRYQNLNLKPMKTNYNEPTTIDDLIDGVNPFGKYSHLQIFLTRKYSHEMRQKYLAVTKNGFGLYELIDFDYSEEKRIIRLLLKECEKGETFWHNIHIDKNPKILFINWNDILKMITES